MAMTYEVWLRRPEGTPLQLLENYEGLQYALLTNDISACRIVLPGNVYDRSLFAPDFRLAVSRQPDSGSRVEEGVWFIRKRKDWTDANGERRLEVTGYSPNYLLKGRIVAYAAASTYALKTDQFDDMMKAVVNEALSTGATTAARRLASTYFSIEPDHSLAPSDTVGFAWRNVLEVLKDLAAASAGAGTDLYFNVEPVNETLFRFRTYTGQPGIDHTYPNGKPPVLLGLDYGNMAEPVVEEDWTDEATYVYAAGQGEEAARVQQTAEDTTRSGRSIFGRREVFEDARNYSTTGMVLVAAQRRLIEGKPRTRFSAKLVETPGTRYGLHWRHGDRVSATYYGQQYDGLIKSVQVSVDRDGHETITAKLETDE